jgi:DNA-binding beta-propeller fold protein YncE
VPDLNMANVDVQQQKRTLKKRDVIIAVLLILLLQLGIFAYFYYKNQDLSNVVLNKIGPVAAPTPLFGIYGSGTMGSLQKPMGVTVYNRKVYVTDTESRRVAVFDYDGNPLFVFGKQGLDKGQFQFPYGITIDNAGQIYVADMYTAKISVFTQDGQFIKYFADGKDKHFQKPAGLFFFDNTIFVTDVGLHKVMAFDTEGKKVLEFGKKGNANGDLMSPNCVTVTKDTIYVSDTGNDRVEKFDRNGKFVAVNTGDQQNKQGSAFINTRGVGVDGRNILYVVSSLTNNLWGFDSDGHKSFQPVGTVGQANDQFNSPNGMFIDGQGRIYIADSSNQRIIVYQN